VGTNTLPTRNRLPNPYFGLQTILFLVFLWFSLINYGGDSNSQIQIFLNLNNSFLSPRRDPVATDGDSTGDLLRVRPI